VCFSVPASKVYAAGARRRLAQADNQGEQWWGRATELGLSDGNVNEVPCSRFLHSIAPASRVMSGRPHLWHSHHVLDPSSGVLCFMSCVAAVNINWALNPSSSGFVMHTQKGSLSLVPGGGASTAPEVDDSKLTRLRIAHGVLMTLAFVLCFPSGALMARHKWLVGAGEVSCTVV